MAPERYRACRPLIDLAGATLLVALLLLSACTRLEPVAPEGFAPFADESGMRAVSPDGVVYRVRVEEDPPAASLGFWSEVTVRHLTGAGYRLRAERDIALVGGEPARVIELEAPVGEEDLSYLVGVIPWRERLVVIESAGPVERFAARREAILEAIRRIRLS